MNEKLTKLFKLCLKARKHGVDCFLNYSPHVDLVNIRIYVQGWGGGEPICWGIYTDWEDANKKIDECVAFIQDTLLNKEG